MRFEWIEDPARFEQLEAAWEQLAERQDSPFLRHAWFAAWWSAFGAGRRLRVCTGWDGDELAAVFPLLAAGRRLEPIENAHTPSFRPFARSEAELRELTREVLRASRGRLCLLGVPADDSSVEELARSSGELGRVSLVRIEARSPFVDTAAGWDAFWSGLSRKTKKDLRHRRNRLEAMGAEVAPLAEPADLEVELEQGLAVEGSGWKSGRGTAIVQEPATSAFYRELARRFARLGKLRFSTVSVDGRVIAFDYVLVDGGRAYTLKGGYDVAHAGLAPGLVLTLAQVERCCKLGLASLELLGEEAAWKLKFTDAARPLVEVHSYERRPLPLTHYAWRRLGRPVAKRAYRRFFPGRARG